MIKKIKYKKTIPFIIAFMLGMLVIVVAIEIGDNITGLDFKNLDVNTENWCKNIDVEKTTDHIVYWYQCKQIDKVTPDNYSVKGVILQRAYDITAYNDCRNRGGSSNQCLISDYDTRALTDIQNYVFELREDILRKQRLAIITREFPPNTERFNEEEING